MKLILALLFTLSLLIAAPHSAPSAAQGVDNRIYADLLKKHVVDGRVNYHGFKADEKLLDDYLAVLSATDANALSKKEQFAFYINAYNAFTIKLILTRYPEINSIKELGGFFSNPWQIKFISLQGRTVTLDYIEHDILRPRFKDPRVHFAINCASRSCPKLRSEPYVGILLDDQLDEQAGAFINDPKNNTIKGNTLFLSKIFKWFKEDFGGNPMAFIKQYAEGPLKAAFRNQEADITVQYLKYDWSLNR